MGPSLRGNSTSTMSISSSSLLALGVVLGALACSEERPPSDPAPRTYVLVDDLEGATGRIVWQPETTISDALPGRWISYADIQCSDLSPVPEWAPDGSGAWHTTEHEEPVETMPGVVSRNAARLVTKAPLVNTWGAGMGFEFYEPRPGTETRLVTRPCSGGSRPDLAYPALLALWARLAPRPVAAAGGTPAVSIVIAVFIGEDAAP